MSDRLLLISFALVVALYAAVAIVAAYSVKDASEAERRRMALELNRCPACGRQF